MKRITILIATVIACSLSLSAQSEVASSPQTDALYRLPFDKGVGCVAHKLTPLQLGLARDYNMVDFCAWQLVATSPTAVVAPRDGVVEKIDDKGVLLRHEENIYTRLRGVEGVVVAEGDSVAKGDKIAATADEVSVAMEVFYVTANPEYGTNTLGGQDEYLRYYINPIFSARGRCKVQLTDGNPYTVKARTWCWPWE